MKMFTSLIRAEQGTTLIELMIALVLTGIVTLAIMKTYVTQHENYLAQDDVTYMQQNARSCIDELTRQIRMAGHNVPLGLRAIAASNTNPDTITVTYHGNDCETVLTAKMASTSAGLVCDDVSCFGAGRWAYVFDPDSAVGEWFQISSVGIASETLEHASSPANLSYQYDADAIVLALNQVKFFVDNTTDPANPALMLQVSGSPAQPYAEHVSDLQFQYLLANGTIVDEPITVSDIRAVMISVSAASMLAGSGGDAERNRTYTSTVSLRNIDG